MQWGLEKNKRCLRISALFTLMTFSFTDLAFAQPLLISPKSEALISNLLPAAISIPENLGTIQIQQKGGAENPFVVFIQDAHAVVDAQNNIQELIQYLNGKYGIDLVALEGGKGRLDPTLLRTFPDEFIKKKILKDYLDRGELAGAQMAAILNPKEEIYEGIEDWDLYQANYIAYLKASANRSELTAELKRVKLKTDSERRQVYSENLNDLHEQVDSFRSEKTHLLDFLKFLIRHKAVPRAHWNEYPHLKPLLESVAMDESRRAGTLDAAVRKMAQGFKTKYAAKLAQKKLMKFNEIDQAYSAGSLDTGNFLKQMVEIAGEIGVSPKLSPSMKELLGQAETLSSLRGTKIFEDLDALIATLEEKYAASDAERDLVERYKKIRLLEDLIGLQLAKDQVEAYQRAPESYRDILGGLASQLTPAEEFYDLALRRDQAFHENLEKLLKKEKRKSAIVLAGGFHSTGFEKTLQASDYSYAIVTPKISSLYGHETYAGVMEGKLSYKKYLNTTFYDAFMRHSMLNMVKELDQPNFRKNLKLWRDDVIRKLAAEGRTAEAGEYTKYIDLLFKAYYDKYGDQIPQTREEILKAIDEELGKVRESVVDRVWKGFQAQFKGLMAGLRGLSDKNELTEEAALQIYDKIAAGKPSVLQTSIIVNMLPGAQVDNFIRLVLKGVSTESTSRAAATAAEQLNELVRIANSGLREEEAGRMFVNEAARKVREATIPASAEIKSASKREISRDMDQIIGEASAKAGVSPAVMASQVITALGWTKAAGSDLLIPAGETSMRQGLPARVSTASQTTDRALPLANRTPQITDFARSSASSVAVAFKDEGAMNTRSEMRQPMDESLLGPIERKDRIMKELSAYEVVEMVGAGAEGEVYKVRGSGGELRALKIAGGDFWDASPDIAKENLTTMARNLQNINGQLAENDSYVIPKLYKEIKVNKDSEFIDAILMDYMGDESGVALTIQEAVSAGLLTAEEAVEKFKLFQVDLNSIGKTFYDIKSDAFRYFNGKLAVVDLGLLLDFDPQNIESENDKLKIFNSLLSPSVSRSELRALTIGGIKQKSSEDLFRLVNDGDWVQLAKGSEAYAYSSSGMPGIVLKVPNMRELLLDDKVDAFKERYGQSQNPALNGLIAETMTVELDAISYRDLPRSFKNNDTQGARFLILQEELKVLEYDLFDEESFEEYVNTHFDSVTALIFELMKAGYGFNDVAAPSQFAVSKTDPSQVVLIDLGALSLQPRNVPYTEEQINKPFDDLFEYSNDDLDKALERKIENLKGKLQAEGLFVRSELRSGPSASNNSVEELPELGKKKSLARSGQLNEERGRILWGELIDSLLLLREMESMKSLDDYYRKLQRVVNPVARVVSDLGQERGEKAISAVESELGPEFIPLLVEPGISTRVNEFISFSKPIVEKMREEGETVSSEKIWEVREGFKSKLGTTVVYRALRLTPEGLSEIHEKGMRSPGLHEFLAKTQGAAGLENIERDYPGERDLLDAMHQGKPDADQAVNFIRSGQLFVRHGIRSDVLARVNHLAGAGSFTQSLTEIPQVAMDIVRSQNLEIGKPYLFKVQIPEIFMLRWNDNYFPHSAEEDEIRVVPNHFITSDGNKYLTTDPKVESFVGLWVQPEWLTEITELPESEATYKMLPLRVEGARRSELRSIASREEWGSFNELLMDLHEHVREVHGRETLGEDGQAALDELARMTDVIHAKLSFTSDSEILETVEAYFDLASALINLQSTLRAKNDLLFDRLVNDALTRAKMIYADKIDEWAIELAENGPQQEELFEATPEDRDNFFKRLYWEELENLSRLEDKAIEHLRGKLKEQGIPLIPVRTLSGDQALLWRSKFSSLEIPDYTAVLIQKQENTSRVQLTLHTASLNVDPKTRKQEVVLKDPKTTPEVIAMPDILERMQTDSISVPAELPEQTLKAVERALDSFILRSEMRNPKLNIEQKVLRQRAVALNISEELISHAEMIPRIANTQEYEKALLRDREVLESRGFLSLTDQQRQALISLQANALGMNEAAVSEYMDNKWSITIHGVKEKLPEIEEFNKSLQEKYPAHKKIFLLGDMAMPFVMYPSSDPSAIVAYFGRGPLTANKITEYWEEKIVSRIREKMKTRPSLQSYLPETESERKNGEWYKKFEKEMMADLQKLIRTDSTMAEVKNNLIQYFKALGILDASGKIIDGKPIVLIDGPQYESMMLVAKAILTDANLNDPSKIALYATASSLTNYEYNTKIFDTGDATKFEVPIGGNRRANLDVPKGQNEVNPSLYANPTFTPADVDAQLNYYMNLHEAAKIRSELRLPADRDGSEAVPQKDLRSESSSERDIIRKQALEVFIKTLSLEGDAKAYYDAVFKYTQTVLPKSNPRQIDFAIELVGDVTKASTPQTRGSPEYKVVRGAFDIIDQKRNEVTGESGIFTPKLIRFKNEISRIAASRRSELRTEKAVTGKWGGRVKAAKEAYAEQAKTDPLAASNKYSEEVLKTISDYLKAKGLSDRMAAVVAGSFALRSASSSSDLDIFFVVDDGEDIDTKIVWDDFSAEFGDEITLDTDIVPKVRVPVLTKSDMKAYLSRLRGPAPASGNIPYFNLSSLLFLSVVNSESQSVKALAEFLDEELKVFYANPTVVGRIVDFDFTNFEERDRIDDPIGEGDVSQFLKSAKGVVDISLGAQRPRFGTSNIRSLMTLIRLLELHDSSRDFSPTQTVTLFSRLEHFRDLRVNGVPVVESKDIDSIVAAHTLMLRSRAGFLSQADNQDIKVKMEDLQGISKKVAERVKQSGVAEIFGGKLKLSEDEQKVFDWLLKLSEMSAAGKAMHQAFFDFVEIPEQIAEGKAELSPELNQGEVSKIIKNYKKDSAVSVGLNSVSFSISTLPENFKSQVLLARKGRKRLSEADLDAHVQAVLKKSQGVKKDDEWLFYFKEVEHFLRKNQALRNAQFTLHKNTDYERTTDFKSLFEDYTAKLKQGESLLENPPQFNVSEDFTAQEAPDIAPAAPEFFLARFWNWIWNLFLQLLGRTEKPISRDENLKPEVEISEFFEKGSPSRSELRTGVDTEKAIREKMEAVRPETIAKVISLNQSLILPHWRIIEPYIQRTEKFAKLDGLRREFEEALDTETAESIQEQINSLENELEVSPEHLEKGGQREALRRLMSADEKEALRLMGVYFYEGHTYDAQAVILEFEKKNFANYDSTSKKMPTTGMILNSAATPRQEPIVWRSVDFSNNLPTRILVNTRQGVSVEEIKAAASRHGYHNIPVIPYDPTSEPDKINAERLYHSVRSELAENVFKTGALMSFNEQRQRGDFLTVLASDLYRDKKYSDLSAEEIGILSWSLEAILSSRSEMRNMTEVKNEALRRLKVLLNTEGDQLRKQSLTLNEIFLKARLSGDEQFQMVKKVYQDLIIRILAWDPQKPDVEIMNEFNGYGIKENVTLSSDRIDRLEQLKENIIAVKENLQLDAVDYGVRPGLTLSQALKEYKISNFQGVRINGEIFTRMDLTFGEGIKGALTEEGLPPEEWTNIRVFYNRDSAASRSELRTEAMGGIAVTNQDLTRLETIDFEGINLEVPVLFETTMLEMLGSLIFYQKHFPSDRYAMMRTVDILKLLVKRIGAPAGKVKIVISDSDYIDISEDGTHLEISLDRFRIANEGFRPFLERVLGGTIRPLLEGERVSHPKNAFKEVIDRNRERLKFGRYLQNEGFGYELPEEAKRSYYSGMRIERFRDISKEGKIEGKKPDQMVFTLGDKSATSLWLTDDVGLAEWHGRAGTGAAVRFSKKNIDRDYQARGGWQEGLSNEVLLLNKNGTGSLEIPLTKEYVEEILAFDNAIYDELKALFPDIPVRIIATPEEAEDYLREKGEMTNADLEAYYTSQRELDKQINATDERTSKVLVDILGMDMSSISSLAPEELYDAVYQKIFLSHAKISSQIKDIREKQKRLEELQIKKRYSPASMTAVLEQELDELTGQYDFELHPEKRRRINDLYAESGIVADLKEGFLKQKQLLFEGGSLSSPRSELRLPAEPADSKAVLPGQRQGELGASAAPSSGASLVFLPQADVQSAVEQAIEKGLGFERLEAVLNGLSEENRPAVQARLNGLFDKMSAKFEEFKNQDRNEIFNFVLGDGFEAFVKSEITSVGFEAGLQADEIAAPIKALLQSYVLATGIAVVSTTASETLSPEAAALFLENSPEKSMENLNAAFAASKLAPGTSLFSREAIENASKRAMIFHANNFPDLEPALNTMKEFEGRARGMAYQAGSSQEKLVIALRRLVSSVTGLSYRTSVSESRGLIRPGQHLDFRDQVDVIVDEGVNVELGRSVREARILFQKGISPQSSGLQFEEYFKLAELILNAEYLRNMLRATDNPQARIMTPEIFNSFIRLLNRLAMDYQVSQKTQASA